MATWMYMKNCTRLVVSHGRGCFVAELKKICAEQKPLKLLLLLICAFREFFFRNVVSDFLVVPRSVCSYSLCRSRLGVWGSSETLQRTLPASFDCLSWLPVPHYRWCDHK